MKIISTFKTSISILALCLLVTYNTIAQRYAVTAGNWSGAIWATTPAGVAGSAATPTSADAVFINSGIVVKEDVASAQCASLTFSAPAAAGGLSIVSTNTLTVSGAVVMNAVTVASTTTFAVGAGTLSAASITINGAAAATKKNVLSDSTGTINCTGNFTFSTGTAAASAILRWLNNTSVINIGGNLTSTGVGELDPLTNSKMSIAGNYAFAGSFSSATTAGYLNLTLNGTGAQYISGTCTFRNLIVNKASGIATASTAITTANNAGINVTNGTLDLSTFTHIVGGTSPTLTVANGATLEIGGTQPIPTFGTYTFGTTSNTIFNGTNQNINAATYGNLTLSGNGIDTVLQKAATVVAGNLNVGNGITVNIDTNFTVTGTTTIGAGTGGNFVFISTTGGTRLFTGLVTVNAGATWNNTVGRACSFHGGITNNGTFTVGGTGVQTFNVNAQNLNGIFNIGKITVTGVSLTNNGTLTVSSALAGTGGVTNLGTLTLDSVSSIDTIDAKATGNTVIFNGTTPQTIPAFTYYNLTCSGTGAITLATNHSINVEGTFTPGTVSYSTNGSTINFNGASQTIPVFKFYNMSLSGSGTKSFAGVDSVEGNLSINGPAIADLGNNNSLANTLTYGSIGQNPGSYGGTGSVAANISPTYFAPVSTGILNVTTIENSWTGVISSDWNNAGNWSYGTVPDSTTNVLISSVPPYQPILSGDTIGYCKNITISAGDSLTIAGSDLLAVYGNFANGGRFLSNTGTVIFAGTSQTVGSATYYNLVMTGKGLKTMSGDTVDGTMVMEDSAFVSAAPVYGSAATLEYNTSLARSTGVEWVTPFIATGGIVVANTGVIKVAAAKVITGSTLTVQSGATLNDTTRIISGTGTFHLMAGGTLQLSKITGINGCFTLTNVILDPSANYIFSNSTAAISAMGAYLTAANNITISNTAFLVTLSGNIAVSGIFKVVSGGILVAGSNVISGSGLFSLSSGATLKTANATGLDGTVTTSGSNYFDPAANYVFNGTVAQTTGLSLPTTANNITINNILGVTLSGPVTVNGILTLTNGLLTTSSVDMLSVSSNLNTAIVTPISTSYINGPMNWNLASGTAYNFPVGNTGGYYPFAITPTGTAPQVQVQAFNGNSNGSADGITIHSISNSEYWSASLISGTISGATVGLTRPTAISPFNEIAISNSANGTYSTLHGTAGVYSVTGSDNTTSLGYFVFGGCANTSNITKSACTSYTLNGSTYTSTGTYTQTLTNISGCDSTLTLNLTINQPTVKSITTTTCGADTVNGIIYTGSGTYTQNLTNVAGCDSTLTLNLTITQPTVNSITATVCGADTVNGTIYTGSGTYIQNLTNKTGCDSTLTLNLTINQPTVNSITATTCGADTVNGTIYTGSGTYVQNLTNISGCDSTLTLNLTINQPTVNSITATVCGADTVNGTIYAGSGTYIQNLTNVAGCDSTLTLNFTITQPTVNSITATTCGADTVNGTIYTGSGTYIQNLTNIAGCDSTLTLNLTITQPTVNSITTTACVADTVNGTIYTGSGTYIQNLTNIVGCDSTLTLNLTINQPTVNSITATTCGADTVNGMIYTTSGTFTQNLTNVAGCDSTLTLNLTINTPPVVSISGQDSIMIGATDTLVASGASTYAWSNGSTSDTIFVSPSSITTYNVTGMQNGCSDTISFSVNVIIITGINSTPANSGGTIYPNPATGMVNITFNTQGTGKAAIVKIDDMNGKEVMSQNCTINNGQATRLDVSTLPQGIYFVKIITGTQTQVMRFVKE